MLQPAEYNYENAFSRNLGWMNQEKQNQIKKTKVAIPGVGGVGSGHALALARLGIEHFHIADFDRFDEANINRQLGATISSIGAAKTSVMKKMLLDINPNIKVKTFNEGVTPKNMAAFLEGVDLLADGLDVYAMRIRRLLFNQCYVRSIPVVTAAPLGGGCGYITLSATGMSPDQYFDWHSHQSELKQLVHFIVGVAPKALHRTYLNYPEYVNPSKGSVCSLSAGVFLASGVLTSKVFAMLVLPESCHEKSPRFYQFDAVLNRWASGRLRWGNRGLIQRFKIALCEREFKKMDQCFANAPE